METTWQAIYYFILALVLALLEIEIEGRGGWAKNLPTWRSTKHNVLLLLTNQRPVTGYWLFCNLFVLLFFHSPLVANISIGASWNLQQEADILFCWLIFLPIWDFLWFVFNPHFGLKNFRQSKIWWHQQTPWLWGLIPHDYLWSILIGLTLPFLVVDFKTEPINNLTNLTAKYYPYFYYLAIQFGLVILAIISSPLYHRLYRSLRKK